MLSVCPNIYVNVYYWTPRGQNAAEGHLYNLTKVKLCCSLELLPHVLDRISSLKGLPTQAAHDKSSQV